MCNIGQNQVDVKVLLWVILEIIIGALGIRHTSHKRETLVNAIFHRIKNHSKKSKIMQPRISEYSVTLEKFVYFPGELVRGRLRLCTNAPINCRGVRTNIEGIGHSYFITEAGDNRRERHSYTKKYVEYKRTIWGKVYATP